MNKGHHKSNNKSGTKSYNKSHIRPESKSEYQEDYKKDCQEDLKKEYKLKYLQIKEITQKQNELILAPKDITEINFTRLNKYIIKKSQLYTELKKIESSLNKDDSILLKNDLIDFMTELYKMENENIHILEKKFQILGSELLSVNNAKKLKKAYSPKESSKKPKFIDKNDL
jgi:hypothetical protein